MGGVRKVGLSEAQGPRSFLMFLSYNPQTLHFPSHAYWLQDDSPVSGFIVLMQSKKEGERATPASSLLLSDFLKKSVSAMCPRSIPADSLLCPSGQTLRCKGDFLTAKVGEKKAGRAWE